MYAYIYTYTQIYIIYIYTYKYTYILIYTIYVYSYIYTLYMYIPIYKQRTAAPFSGAATNSQNPVPKCLYSTKSQYIEYF